MSSADKKKVSASEISKFLNGSSSTSSTRPDAAIHITPTSVVQSEPEVNTKSTINFSRRSPVRKSRVERARDNIEVLLDTYKNGEKSEERIKAFSILVQTIRRQPKTSILETVYKFFVANKDEEFLDPAHALQSQATLSKDESIKVRIFWRIMYSLAKGTATRKNTSLDTLRTIFQSDDFVNWVAYKLNNLSRVSKIRK